MMGLYILTLYLINNYSMKVNCYYVDVVELVMLFSYLAIIRKNILTILI